MLPFVMLCCVEHAMKETGPISSLHICPWSRWYIAYLFFLQSSTLQFQHPKFKVCNAKLSRSFQNLHFGHLDSLVAMAVNRYQNIARPLRTSKTERKSVLLVFVVWSYAVIVSGPSVFSVDRISVLEIPEAQAQGLEDCEDCADRKLCDIPQNSLRVPPLSLSSLRS